MLSFINCLLDKIVIVRTLTFYNTYITFISAISGFPGSFDFFGALERKKRAREGGRPKTLSFFLVRGDFFDSFSDNLGKYYFSYRIHGGFQKHLYPR